MWHDKNTQSRTCCFKNVCRNLKRKRHQDGILFNHNGNLATFRHPAAGNTETFVHRFHVLFYWKCKHMETEVGEMCESSFISEFSKNSESTKVAKDCQFQTYF